MKSHLSEAEAAEALGVSVEHFRTLVRNHIIQDDADSGNLPAATYQPSDLIILRLLAGTGPRR